MTLLNLMNFQATLNNYETPNQLVNSGFRDGHQMYRATRQLLQCNNFESAPDFSYQRYFRLSKSAPAILELDALQFSVVKKSNLDEVLNTWSVIGVADDASNCGSPRASAFGGMTPTHISIR